VRGHQLLRIRNPWGEGEWKGAWSDNATEWTQEILDELQYKFSEDGTFWIEMADWIEQYNQFYINRLFDQTWFHSFAFGEWKGVTAGGCGNFPTWKNNPQFSFTIEKGDDVFFTLMQKDTRMSGEPESNLNIGFLLLRATGELSLLKKKKRKRKKTQIHFLFKIPPRKSLPLT
jgi:hypothetical protein